MSERGGFGFRCRKFGFRLRDVEFTADAAFESAAHESHLFVT